MSDPHRALSATKLSTSSRRTHACRRALREARPMRVCVSVGTLLQTEQMRWSAMVVVVVAGGRASYLVPEGSEFREPSPLHDGVHKDDATKDHARANDKG